MSSKIKENRVAKGMTQIEVAIKLGVHVNTYRLWEQGGGKPSEENQKKIEALLGS